MRIVQRLATVPCTGERGSVRTLVLAVVCLALGAVGSAWVLSSRSGSSQGAGLTAARSDAVGGLTEETKAILGRLQHPVEVRFYRILDPGTVSPELLAFAQRVETLLTAYGQASGGKVQVRRFESDSDADAQAAATDGLQAFNREKGRACYLGLSVGQLAQKQTISLTRPAWEGALEADLSRAIENALARPVAARVEAAPVDPAAEQAVRKAVPDLDKVSLEEANRRLRQNALEEFARAISELSPAIKAAEERVKASRNPAEEEAARQALKDLQQQQADKLKDLAARSESEVQALRQLKANAQ